MVIIKRLWSITFILNSPTSVKRTLNKKENKEKDDNARNTLSTDNNTDSEVIIHLSPNAVVSPEGKALGEFQFQETTYMYLPQCHWIG